MKNKISEMISLRQPNKVMPHDEFIDRIRKSLYFGADTLADDMEVSRPLAEYASELFSEPHKGHSLNRLHSVAAGNVHATPYSLIMALIYLDRLNITDPGYLRGITPQELFIVSMMISTKFYAGHDEEFYLSDWAEDGNMSEERLKQLELEFLSAIEWNIYISNEHFFSKLSNVEKTLAKREGLRRGWLTYSELMQLLPSFTLVKFLLNNITIMVVSYAASVMTIAGAFFLASQIPGNALYRKTTPCSSALNMSNDLLVEPTIMPTPTTADETLNTENNGTRVTTTPLTISNSSTNTTSTPTTNYNGSCNALNVEAELLKLERQYREEAIRENLRHRNSEIVNHWRVILPASATTIQKLNNSKENAQLQHTQQLNWLAFKEEYSEDLADSMEPITLGQTDAPDHHCYTNGGTTADNNSTDLLFWQLLANAAQHSLVRLPLMRFGSSIHCLQPLYQQTMQQS